MTFLAPGFLYASLAAAAAIVSLHFIVTRQPRASILPTARFVPDTPATTVASARRPSDWLLLLLRVLTVLAAGAAVAKPVFQPSRRAQARVILVDVSRSAPDAKSIRDSARAIYKDGDGLVLFDSAARVVTGNQLDTLGAITPSSKRGDLSAALIQALRAGSSLRDRADSLELVLVSPLAQQELDAATDSVRELWRGRIRLVRVGAGTSDTGGPVGRLQISAENGDPLTVTASLLDNAIRTPARIERTDSSVPTNSTGATGALIEWLATSRPTGALPRAPVDTIGGVSAGDARVVSAFERRWSYPVDSLRGAAVVARWADGQPAAIERPSGVGCVRSVAIPVASAGDLAIRRDFIQFVAALTRPCAQATASIPADPSQVARLVGTGGLAPREAFQPRTDSRSSLAPWLLVLAIATVIGELFARRRARDSGEFRRENKTSREARAA